MRASYRRRAQLSSCMSAEEPQTAAARPTWLGRRFRCREYSPSAIPSLARPDRMVTILFRVPRGVSTPRGKHVPPRHRFSLSAAGGPGIQLVPSADSAREPPDPRAERALPGMGSVCTRFQCAPSVDRSAPSAGSACEPLELIRRPVLLANRRLHMVRAVRHSRALTALGWYPQGSTMIECCHTRPYRLLRWRPRLAPETVIELLRTRSHRLHHQSPHFTPRGVSTPRAEHTSPLHRFSLSVIEEPGIQLVPSAGSAREPPDPCTAALCRAWAVCALAFSALSPLSARPHQPVLLANRWGRWVLRGCSRRQRSLPR